METEKLFRVRRMTNGRGVSNLLAIVNEAIEDIEIGDAVLIPSINGNIDPIEVLLEIDNSGNPIRDNNIAIPKKYIYQPENNEMRHCEHCGSDWKGKGRCPECFPL